ncbi:Protein of unknown function (DUF1645 [Striga hermonthica]|uniref:Uncharacterized protein n=1 Tax=Striga hermonthica TaxID=68872 RepID=A0A9N7N052_STRHE|nr:Protein of unknown function (DUF1645 [Striga hermonthica]
MQTRSAMSLSPSFNTNYSNTRLAGITARVAGEFASDGFRDKLRAEGEENWRFLGREKTWNTVIPGEDSGEDSEFEFSFAGRGSEMPSPVSADEIFCNGQIRPVYPFFNADLFPNRIRFGRRDEEECSAGSTVRMPLMKLFIEEREPAAATTSSSSSGADELDGVPADTYCVWRPKEAAAEVRCGKSSSVGSRSKRWRIGDLLRRSHSDGGKDRFLVFLSRGGSWRKAGEGEEKVKIAGKVRPAAARSPLGNRDGDEKRRSYSPHRQDFLGLIAGVNGSSKNLQPF